jgi:ribosomal-protein-alanine N-acetyltransferase
MGKGFATEAAKAAIRSAFDDMRIPKLFAGHNPKNATSKRMLAKLGFKYSGDQFYEPTGLCHPSYELTALDR